MPQGFPRPQGSSGESISHWTGVRMRITGTGNLDMTLHSYNELESVALVPFAMSSTNAREPLRLCNFSQQRIILELGTDEKDEIFRINRIILFGRELWKDWPAGGN